VYFPLTQTFSSSSWRWRWRWRRRAAKPQKQNDPSRSGHAPASLFLPHHPASPPRSHPPLLRWCSDHVSSPGVLILPPPPPPLPYSSLRLLLDTRRRDLLRKVCCFLPRFPCRFVPPCRVCVSGRQRGFVSFFVRSRTYVVKRSCFYGE
jgi:hypothetical protein